MRLSLMLSTVAQLSRAQSPEEIMAAVAKKAAEDRITLESSQGDLYDDYFQGRGEELLVSLSQN